MIFYRYEDMRYTDRVRVIELKFTLDKETPCGYWIFRNGSSLLKNNRKWVSKTSKNRYAYPTRKEALENFVARKNRQIEILSYQLEVAKDALYYLEVDTKGDYDD